jgi:protein TonB
MNTPIYADLDQIVFEGRSQAYGAYQMRQRYNRVLTRAMLIAFLSFISLTGLPKMLDWIAPDEIALATTVDEGVTVIPDIPLPPKAEPLKDEVPAIPAPPKPDVRTIAVTIPNPTPDELIRDDATIADLADLDSAAIGLVTKDGDPGEDYPWKDIDGNCPTCPIADEVVLVNAVEPDPKAFVLLEQEPQPVNLDELKHLIGYPPMAKEAEIEGRVVMRVMVDQHGDYVKHVVLKDPHPILTHAVAAQINHLKMTPGIQSGKPIKVWVTLPFDFQLLH